LKNEGGEKDLKFYRPLKNTKFFLTTMGYSNKYLTLSLKHRKKSDRMSPANHPPITPRNSR
jgi:hypothetical protein